MCILFWKKKERPVEHPAVLEQKPIMEERGTVMKEELIVIEEVVEDVVEDVEKEKKVKIQKYHVSQNKDKDAAFYMKWRVRKESSDKTIQYFDTQKLAIEFAQDLATKLGTTVVIHKLDGSIRKQDYTNKE